MFGILLDTRSHEAVWGVSKTFSFNSDSTDRIAWVNQASRQGLNCE